MIPLLLSVLVQMSGANHPPAEEELDSLLAPELSVSARFCNAPGKSVLKVRLRNVPKLHFRAYKVLDLPNVLAEMGARHVGGASDEDETEVFQKKRWISLLKTWSMEVPVKEALKAQELEVVPKLPGKGAYWLLVSHRNTFLPNEAGVRKILLLQTELVLVVHETKGGFEVLVANALTGAPEAGINVRAETGDGQNPSVSYRLAKTNREGKTSLKKTGGPFVVWASRGDDMAVASWAGADEPSENEAANRHFSSEKALVFLDRAVYRPGHPLFYKAIFLRPQVFSFVPAANEKLEVSFYDAKGNKLASQSQETNAFGSIGGELKIPEGAPLGKWSLTVGNSKQEEMGKAQWQVEEYKRPNFEGHFFERQEGEELDWLRGGEMEDAPLFVAGKAIRLPVSSTDWSDVGQKSQGTWRLYALNPPSKRILSEEASTAEEDSTGFESTTDWQKELSKWEVGKEQKQGEVFLDEQGEGEVDLGQLPRGAFRVVFEAFGKPPQVVQELLVVDSRLGVPFASWIHLEKEEVRAGEELKMLLGSKHKGQAFYVELFRRGKRIAARWIRAGERISAFKWRVQEEDQGGLSIRILRIRDFEAHETTKQIAVPWDSKKLGLSFSSFSDTLRPGEKKRFVLSVTHKGKPVGKGEAEVLGLIYDSSLDFFHTHRWPTALELYPQNTLFYSQDNEFGTPRSISLHEDFIFLAENLARIQRRRWIVCGCGPAGQIGKIERVPVVLRSSTRFGPDFSEKVFFLPFLTTDEKGQVVMDFEVPDALTTWKVMAIAHNKLGQASKVLTQEARVEK